MMKTEKEYELAKKQLAKLDEMYETQLADLKAKGLSEEQAKDSLSSSWTYAMQCKEEVELYEKLKRGELPPMESFASKGKYFIAARIARGMTQRELAEKLNVKESAISRDERNEYHGISMDKMDRLAHVLNLKVLITS
ncbi:MAG: hypothetical protein QG574_5591 [Cyanobacteriota bacterium erpe_2018_sw_21hr_WHONDRS-SW48-000092_B_bin.40]|jgi:DNA-binding XRE family transcriptional regulator|nr:hypothetical protein [Cyanobacteriota bacterium erpe_2018_sw_21hr_WHONDRS-SW48-000092_B_bin.40]